ncbi:TauD/TfdA family dioxygenase [Microbulbifer variabilis]|uniref:TauD/TfdA family dioxygenase n=1 Tax=Microbulbifer variabilis TaxID=266805 RepID=UPI00037595F4|nr:TauD/TfdA family dioxygenase [Microbulbifer variabilis]
MSSLHLSSHAIPLRVPDYCCFNLGSNSDYEYESYKIALLKKGIVLIRLGFPDDSAEIMKNIISTIGLIHEHDGRGRTVWDVRIGGETGDEALAISHSDREFNLHNDGAFEQEMPGYFGLHVVRADTLGGGESVLVCADRIIESLSERAFQVLSNKRFRLRVPEEFHKKASFIEATLIDESHGFRYRYDIIERSLCSKDELEALSELELKISLPHNMFRFHLGDNQILLLDNRRYLHTRTKIKDKKRHLKRIRFNMPATLRVA